MTWPRQSRSPGAPPPLLLSQQNMAMNSVDRMCSALRGPWVCLLTAHRLGAFGVSFGLPLVTYLLTFLCNDVSGCPVPSLLHPSTLTLEKLKQEVGWPENGFLGLVDLRVTALVLAYYVFSLILWRVLPGEEVKGMPTPSGTVLKYKFNSMHPLCLPGCCHSQLY